MTSIPYTTDVRPDTGLTNPKLGIWLFLASEVMLFGSLFSAYALLRSGAVSWPDQSSVVSVPLATLNTIILISSSVTMVLAWVSLTMRRLDRYRMFMGLTLLLGAAFLAVKGIEYSDKLAPEMSCPVCFGSVEPAVRESMNAGIFVLLGVTVAVLGCFARFFVALARRSRAAAHVDAGPLERAVQWRVSSTSLPGRSVVAARRSRSEACWE